ncbi:interleukin-13 receptor subunit alpha-1-like [Clinocottus analis]|uniref:interleukin-13 receptor subunit alpha-1-like n=1 Tax=Clinocottus analis TaxID=304258 RepID=UPI0035C0CDD1
MTSPAELFAFLTFTAVSLVCHSKAEGLPPPTNGSYRWIDAFTVNVSWEEPRGLLAGSFKYCHGLEEPDIRVRSSIWRHFTEDLLTEDKGRVSWTYLVWTVRGNNSIPEESTKMSITVETPRPRAQVKDIKCLVTPEKEMNCSWTPGNEAVALSFRVDGLTNKTDTALKKCERPYGDALRNGCYLNASDFTEDIYMLFESEAGLSTLKLTPMIDPPELSVGEEGDHLKLSWTRPKILKVQSLIFTVCYKKCRHDEVCLNYTTTEESVLMRYDKNCRYEIRSSVRTGPYNLPFFSEFGRVVSHGTNKAADKTLTVVAVVVPIVLSVCILLSCYCFRRHSSILCPVIPDPSVIFKEMMINGNKELKTTTGRLYTPVPEPVEPCKVDAVTAAAVVSPNS